MVYFFRISGHAKAEPTHLRPPCINLIPRALDLIQAILDLIHRAMYMLEVQPRIPHRLWPVEVLAVHVVEDVAGGVDLALFAMGERWLVMEIPTARGTLTSSNPYTPARPRS